MSGQYLDILEESLQKKTQVLDEIIQKNREQKAILDADPFDMDAFDANTDAKGELIDRLNLLDEGFDTVYERVKEELESNKEAHAGQIRRLQALIQGITDRSVSIQAEEVRNKSLVEAKFQKEREKIQLGKSSMKVAKQYYASMNKTSVVDPQFMDNKK